MRPFPMPETAELFRKYLPPKLENRLGFQHLPGSRPPHEMVGYPQHNGVHRPPCKKYRPNFFSLLRINRAHTGNLLSATGYNS